MFVAELGITQPPPTIMIGFLAFISHSRITVSDLMPVAASRPRRRPSLRGAACRTPPARDGRPNMEEVARQRDHRSALDALISVCGG